MKEAYICDAIRTPVGRYGGALASVRADDLAAIPIAALMARNPATNWAAVDDVILGCANQAGEDNRNVARMAALLAKLPADVPGGTVNRLCGSGMDAIGTAARAIKAGEAGLMIAGGVESMSRAPFVMGKATSAFSRAAKIEDTTIGWRFVNPAMAAAYGVDSMPETAENVAGDFEVSRPIRTPLPCVASSERHGLWPRGVSRARSYPLPFRRKRAIRFWSIRTSIRALTRHWTSSQSCAASFDPMVRSRQEMPRV